MCFSRFFVVESRLADIEEPLRFGPTKFPDPLAFELHVNRPDFAVLIPVEPLPTVFAVLPPPNDDLRGARGWVSNVACMWQYLVPFTAQYAQSRPRVVVAK